MRCQSTMTGRHGGTEDRGVDIRTLTKCEGTILSLKHTLKTSARGVFLCVNVHGARDGSRVEDEQGPRPEESIVTAL